VIVVLIKHWIFVKVLVRQVVWPDHLDRYLKVLKLFGTPFFQGFVYHCQYRHILGLLSLCHLFKQVACALSDLSQARAYVCMRRFVHRLFLDEWTRGQSCLALDDNRFATQIPVVELFENLQAT